MKRRTTKRKRNGVEENIYTKNNLMELKINVLGCRGEAAGPYSNMWEGKSGRTKNEEQRIRKRRERRGSSVKMIK